MCAQLQGLAVANLGGWRVGAHYLVLSLHVMLGIHLVSDVYQRIACFVIPHHHHVARHTVMHLIMAAAEQYMHCWTVFGA